MQTRGTMVCMRLVMGRDVRHQVLRVALSVKVHGSGGPPRLSRPRTTGCESICYRFNLRDLLVIPQANDTDVTLTKPVAHCDS